MFSNAALHWMKEDPEKVVRGVYGVLEEGGRFVGEVSRYGRGCRGELMLYADGRVPERSCEVHAAKVEVLTSRNADGRREVRSTLCPQRPGPQRHRPRPVVLPHRRLVPHAPRIRGLPRRFLRSVSSPRCRRVLTFRRTRPANHSPPDGPGGVAGDVWIRVLGPPFGGGEGGSDWGGVRDARGGFEA